MDELALVPRSADTEMTMAENECTEPIAELNFNRKKMFTNEQGIKDLQKTTRQQHEVLSRLESGIKSMISETDLRRAVGLAFQEFEHRLEDAFTDSNRKCLSMFSKRDDVVELQAKIEKKVNWAEYNTVLKKLMDLRLYIDTMAESIFIGHRDALNSEFAKKANASEVERALKSKADFDTVNEVRAQLERLEVLVSQTDMKQSAKLEALREEAAEKQRVESEKQMALLAANSAALATIRDEHSVFAQRLGGAEAQISTLSKTTENLREVQQALSKHHEQVIMPTITSMQEQLESMDAAASQMQQDLEVLANDAKGFQDASQKKFGELSEQGNSCTKQIAFLMEATEMIKRRERETKKTHTSKFQEHGDQQEKLGQQTAALERQLKKYERDVRHLETRSFRAENTRDFGTMLALPPVEPQPVDPHSHLKNVLDQLEKIASSGPPHELAGVDWNHQRPPLPFGGDGTRRGTDADFAKLQLPGVTELDAVPIDSARGYTMSAYGLSPRAGAPASARATKKKR